MLFVPLLEPAFHPIYFHLLGGDDVVCQVADFGAFEVGGGGPGHGDGALVVGDHGLDEGSVEVGRGGEGFEVHVHAGHGVHAAHTAHIGGGRGAGQLGAPDEHALYLVLLGRDDVAGQPDYLPVLGVLLGDTGHVDCQLV